MAEKMNTATLTPLEKEIMTVETAITLPEKSAPIRLPTKYSSEPTIVYGPNPTVITLDFPDAGTTLWPCPPDSTFHVTTNHPFLSDITPVKCFANGSAAQSVYNVTINDEGVPTEVLTCTGVLGVLAASEADHVPLSFSTPNVAAVSGIGVDDATAIHGAKQVHFKSVNRRGMYLDKNALLSIWCITGALNTVFLNIWKYDGDGWSRVTPQGFSFALVAGGRATLSALKAGVYSYDLVATKISTYRFQVTNEVIAAGAPAIGQFGTFSVGAPSANRISMIAFLQVEGLLSQWGAFERVRVNCKSQRLTSVAATLNNGGVIDQAQPPAGDDVNDVLDGILNVTADPVAYVQKLPTRRFEPNKQGSNAPMTPDGPTYWDYRKVFAINANNVVTDCWIDLDQNISCLVCSVKGAPETTGYVTQKFAATTNTHVEAFGTTKLLERAKQMVSAAALDKAIEHLSGMYLVTENPDHVSDILGKLWDSIRGGVGTIGKSVIAAGATMGPLAPIAFGLGGAMTGASMLSSGAIKNALGMRAETGARLAAPAVERVIEATRAPPRQQNAGRGRSTTPAPKRVPSQNRRQPKVVEIVEERRPERMTRKKPSTNKGRALIRR